MANKERSDKESTDKELEDLHDRLGKVFPSYAKIHKEVDIELKEKASESKDIHKADKGIPVNIMPRIKKSCNKIHREADNESQEKAFKSEDNPEDSETSEEDSKDEDKSGRVQEGARPSKSATPGTTMRCTAREMLKANKILNAKEMLKA